MMARHRLASYMESAHEFFRENFYGVLESEAEAERFALTSQKPLWALVVVHSPPRVPLKPHCHTFERSPAQSDN